MMADVDEIIDYLKSLRRGFDKDLFQSKIDELGYAVDKTGLEYDDFHNLFKVWLNLSIPISKWMSLGVCLVPPNKVDEHTLNYALCWLMANYDNQSNFPRINFLFDWLTAAMDSGCIDMNTLYIGYEVFYSMLTYETIAPHVMKLVYTLTKPMHVTRLRVLELLRYAKKREAQISKYRQLQVLLGLFKSYRPDCVPEGVPAISIYTAFRNLNVKLVERFQRNRARPNTLSKGRQQLKWTFNSDTGKNYTDHIIPNMQFVHIGSNQNTEMEQQKTYLDFSDPVSLVEYSLHHSMCRPARLRALLGNETGLLLLTVASRADQAFLSYDLHHLLTICFLEISTYSYIEKQYLLRRLVLLQRTLLQGIPVVTRFLALYIQFWNEKDFFSEILELIEWVSVVCVEYVEYIAGTVARVYHHAGPIRQCALLHALTNMHSNLIYASKNNRLVFMGETREKISQENYQEALSIVAAIINNTCSRGLQVNPEDMRTVYTCVRSVELLAAAAMVQVKSQSAVPPAPAPPVLALALPLLSVSAVLIDKTAGIFTLYKKNVKQIQNVYEYAFDMICCLHLEDPFSCRNRGLVFKNLHPELVKKLTSIIPNVNTILSIRNHLAFAPYMPLRPIDCRDMDNKLFINAIIDQELPNLCGFLKEPCLNSGPNVL